MKKLLGLVGCTCLSAVLVFGTTGCPDKTKDKTVKTTDKKVVTETTTDKEKKKTTEEKTVVETTKKWTVKAPADVTITQGETATVHVDITREKFTDSVDVKFTGLPDGVTVPEKDWMIAKEAVSAKFTLKAAADAKPVSDHKVTVTTSSGTVTQEASFKVTVKKKAEVTKETVEPKKDKDEVKKDKDAVKKDKDAVKKDKDAVNKDKDAVNKDARLSSDAINFYALLNDRFLMPVYAVRSLQAQPLHAGRNEPHVTA